MKIDIVIPVYNQPRRLKLVLYGFSKITSVYPFKIIVVDDGSTDNLKIKAIVNEFTNCLDIKYIYQDNGGRAAARNKGTEECEGDLLIFNDGDRIPSKYFVKEHLEFHNNINNKKTLVLGLPKELYISESKIEYSVVERIHENKIKSRLSPFTSSVVNIFDQKGFTDSGIPFISTFSGNMSIQRKLFLETKFNEHIKEWGHENIELGHRLFLNKVQFFLNSDAVNYHLAHPRPKDFYLKGIEYSKSFLKGNNAKDVSLVSNFLLGNISLQSLEMSIGNNDATWLTGPDKEIRNKLIKV